MANIPGWSYMLPGGDPVIPMTIGTPEGQLVTDDWGNEFKIEGNIRLAALAVLKHALYWKEHAYLGIGFSRLDFNFHDNVIEIKARSGSRENKDVLLLIEEMRKILDLKAFL